jgi:ribonuclease HI
MELTAVLSALEALKEPCRLCLQRLEVYSRRVEKGGLLPAGKAEEADKEKQKYRLWRGVTLLKVHKVSFIWLKGMPKTNITALRCPCCDRKKKI